MSRRLMLRNASGGGRLYIFKDGAYGDWLNGEVFRSGGYTEGQSYSTMTASISGGNLVFSVLGKANRTAHRCMGILLPSGKNFKKAGIVATRNTLTRSPSQGFVVSETFNVATSPSGAFGTYSGIGNSGGWDEEIPLQLEGEFDITRPDLSNYACIWLGFFSNSTVTLTANEIWVE